MPSSYKSMVQLLKNLLLILINVPAAFLKGSDFADEVLLEP